MKKKTSSGDGKHPYMCSDKINYFWLNNPLYSEKSQAYLNEVAQAFIDKEANSKKVNWKTR